MTKEREQVYNKYGRKCAYCGHLLGKKWHVDHLLPVVREDGIMKYPERDCLSNKMPACISCNINKHSMSLEDFRDSIKNYMVHLNTVSTQYKIAKRYGLVEEVDIPVKFYFEKIGQ
jgi:hypothetical protein